MTIRLRVVWVGLKFLLCSTDHVLHFSEHRQWRQTFSVDIYYKACSRVLWKIIVDSFYFGIDVYHNTEDESRPLIDWYRKRMKLRKKAKYLQFMATVNILHEQSRSRQQMHSITVCHLREGWTNNVSTKRQGRCLFPFSCLFESYRKSRVKSPRNKVFIKAAIKGLLWSLFGHDYFNLNLQAVRVGGLTQSFKYTSKRHCYDNIIFASIFQISYFLSI